MVRAVAGVGVGLMVLSVLVSLAGGLVHHGPPPVPIAGGAGSQGAPPSSAGSSPAVSSRVPSPQSAPLRASQSSSSPAGGAPSQASGQAAAAPSGVVATGLELAAALSGDLQGMGLQPWGHVSLRRVTLRRSGDGVVLSAVLVPESRGYGTSPLSEIGVDLDGTYLADADGRRYHLAAASGVALVRGGREVARGEHADLNVPMQVRLAWQAVPADVTTVTMMVEWVWNSGYGWAPLGTPVSHVAQAVVALPPVGSEIREADQR